MIMLYWVPFLEAIQFLLLSVNVTALVWILSRPMKCRYILCFSKLAQHTKWKSMKKHGRYIYDGIYITRGHIQSILEKTVTITGGLFRSVSLMSWHTWPTRPARDGTSNHHSWTQSLSIIWVVVDSLGMDSLEGRDWAVYSRYHAKTTSLSKL